MLSYFIKYITGKVVEYSVVVPTFVPTENKIQCNNQHMGFQWKRHSNRRIGAQINCTLQSVLEKRRTVVKVLKYRGKTNE